MKRLTQRGLSLLEVLASVTIFSLAAAGLASSTVATIKGNGVSRDTAAAVALLQDKIEQFRAADPTANPADLTPGYHSDPLSPLNSLGQPGGVFTRSWTVAPNTPRLGLSQVTVRVAWSGPEPRSVQATTYVCRTATCS